MSRPCSRRPSSTAGSAPRARRCPWMRARPSPARSWSASSRVRARRRRARRRRRATWWCATDARRPATRRSWSARPSFRSATRGRSVRLNSGGWAPYRPTGVEMRYLTLRPDEGPFSFTRTLGRADGRQTGRCHRAGSQQSCGHLPHRGGGVRLHLRGGRAGGRRRLTRGPANRAAGLKLSGRGCRGRPRPWAGRPPWPRW